jgi:hypothetical protein
MAKLVGCYFFELTLITEKGWTDKQLRCEKSISNIMNRLDFRLRHVQKAKPLKSF